MRFLRVLVACVFVTTLFVSGCSGTQQPKSVQPAAQPPAQAVAPSPSPTTTVSWFWSSSDAKMPLFRFAATVSNPGPKPLDGVTTEWIAYDKDNAIVGNYKSGVPVIPANGSTPYVGGAGAAYLSGIPARVDFHVVSSGKFVESAPASLTASAIKLSKDAPNQYTVNAKVTTGNEVVKSADLWVFAVLKNDQGKVIGADFWLPENVPDSLPPGSAFIVKMPMISTTGKAATAEVTALEHPQQ